MVFLYVYDSCGSCDYQAQDPNLNLYVTICLEPSYLLQSHEDH